MSHNTALHVSVRTNQLQALLVIIKKEHNYVITGQISQSGALTPLREYYVWWSHETLSAGLLTR